MSFIKRKQGDKLNLHFLFSKETTNVRVFYNIYDPQGLELSQGELTQNIGGFKFFEEQEVMPFKSFLTVRFYVTKLDGLTPSCYANSFDTYEIDTLSNILTSSGGNGGSFALRARLKANSLTTKVKEQTLLKAVTKTNKLKAKTKEYKLTATIKNEKTRSKLL